MISPLSNPAELRARGALARSTRALSASLERLATGKRINRASDDPSGLASATELKGREREITAKLDSFEQESFYLGAREGAQSVLSDLLLDLKGLVVTGANHDALSDAERKGLQTQADGIIQTIDFLANTSQYKGVQILTGFNAGALGGVSKEVVGEDGTATTKTFTLADLAGGGKLNLVDGDAETAAKAVDAAASFVSGSRAAIGAREKSIDAESAALRVELENTSAARSAIEDTDYAKESAELVRQQVLQQAALFSQQLAAKQASALIVDLLKN